MQRHVEKSPASQRHGQAAALPEHLRDIADVVADRRPAEVDDEAIEAGVLAGADIREQRRRKLGTLTGLLGQRTPGERAGRSGTGTGTGTGYWHSAVPTSSPTTASTAAAVPVATRCPDRFMFLSFSERWTSFKQTPQRRPALTHLQISAPREAVWIRPITPVSQAWRRAGADGRALPPREVSRLGHVQDPHATWIGRPSLAIIAMAAHRRLG